MKWKCLLAGHKWTLCCARGPNISTPQWCAHRRCVRCGRACVELSAPVEEWRLERYLKSGKWHEVADWNGKGMK